MALRLLVLALLLANGLYFGWTWLAGNDTSSGAAAREARQVRPQSVRVLGPAEASAALAAAGRAPARASCVEAGPFAPEQIDSAERQLAALPWGSWQRNSVERPSAYAVYQGRFASVAAAQARRAELAQQHAIEAEPVTQPPDLAPGLALGRYERRAEADAALAAQAARRLPGADSARITTLPAATEHWLRVEAPSAALTSQLAALPSADLAGGFRPCAGG